MWIITVVVTFLSAAIGVNIPQSLFEGPLVVTDQSGKPLLFATESECRIEAQAMKPIMQAHEQHVHGTDGLEVRWTCTLESSDL